MFFPTKVEYQEDKQNKNKGSVIIEPCYPGYGTTWGNALRRVLLTSLEGAAVTAVKIRGARYEFSTLDYVQEDILDIILNLKLLRLKIFKETDKPIKLTLKASGERRVTARDVDKSADVEIVNPDLLIANLTDKKAKLEMEIWVEKGYGWVPSEEKSREDKDIGTIIVDSIFTPVLNVAVNIENVRVGKRTDYDKLILTIETDGIVSPLQAFLAASKLLAEQFNLLIERGEKLEEREAREELAVKKKAKKRATTKEKIATKKKKKTATAKKTAAKKKK